MEEKMTVTQVLEITVRQLSELSIPISMIDQIGIPVGRAVNNLKLCLNAIKPDETQKDLPDGEVSDKV